MNEYEQIESNKRILIEYLENVHKTIKSRPERYILAHGTLFAGREPSKNVFERPNFEPKSNRCYYNSQFLAIDKDLKYFEGFAHDGLNPLEHAWNVSDGKVIDITWELNDRKFKENHDATCIYYGIEIPTDFVRKNLKERELGEPLLFNYLRSLGCYLASIV